MMGLGWTAFLGTLTWNPDVLGNSLLYFQLKEPPFGGSYGRVQSCFQCEKLMALLLYIQENVINVSERLD